MTAKVGGSGQLSTLTLAFTLFTAFPGEMWLNPGIRIKQDFVSVVEDATKGSQSPAFQGECHDCLGWNFVGCGCGY